MEQIEGVEETEKRKNKNNVNERDIYRERVS